MSTHKIWIGIKKQELSFEYSFIWSYENDGLTFITFWTNSTDDTLMIFFLDFPENRICHFMQIVSSGDNLHEMSKPFSEKSKKKYFIMLSSKFYQECKALTSKFGSMRTICS